MKKKKAVLNWSGGKDSAHALYKILQEDKYEVVSLLTTINQDSRLSTMHNIPISLLKVQSEHLGLPLEIVGLKTNGSMEDYSKSMEKVAIHFRNQGVTDFIFGDIFLHDVRSYRQKQLTPLGINVVEPLWGKTSQTIMDEFLETGLKTIIVTTMDNGLGETAIGKILDRPFVDNLPNGMDPNGENGEYHTFCYAGPIYDSPIPFTLGTPYKKSYNIGLDDGSEQTFTYCFVDLHTK